MTGLSGVFGWFENRWIRQPLMLGPSVQLAEYITEVNAIAGTNDLMGVVVPSNEIWVVLSLAFMSANTVNPHISAGVWSDNFIYPSADIITSVLNHWYGFSSYLVLFPGYKAYCRFEGCVLNDNIYFRYTGFKLFTGVT